MPSPPNLDDLSFLKEIPDLPAGLSAASEPIVPGAAEAKGLSDSGKPVASVSSQAALRALRLPASPDRSQARRRFRHALALAVAWLAAHLAVYGVRENLNELPLSYLLVQVAAPVVIGVISMLIALSPGRLGLGAALSVTATLALIGPLSFAGAALGLPAPVPVEFGTWVSHFVCLDLTLVWMSVPLLLFAFHLRGAFASGAGFRSALVGGACGLFAGAMMNLHCNSVEQIHMVLGHAVPVGIGSLIGGLFISRWLKA
jgi:hypothetical protein